MDEANPGGYIAGSEDALNFEFEMIARDATEEDLDHMTRKLLSESRDTNVDSAESVSRGAAQGEARAVPIRSVRWR